MIDGDVERDDRDFFRLKIHRFNTFSAKKASLSIFKKPKRYVIISVPLLNMTSTAPLSVVLSLLSQRKEGKRGRSVSHV